MQGNGLLCLDKIHKQGSRETDPYITWKQNVMSMTKHPNSGNPIQDMELGQGHGGGKSTLFCTKFSYVML